MPTIPQSERQYVEEQKRICQAEWFKDHKAQCQATGDIGKIVWSTSLLIHWQNPKSWNYGCRFIIHRQWLIVVGDIGEAVYQWSDDITLEFLAQLDFGYFLGKCQASEKGRDFSMWDSGVAEQKRSARIAEIKTPSQPLEEGEEEYPESPEADELEALEELEGQPEDEFKAKAQDYYDATGDAEGAGDLSSMGKVPNCRAIGHFVGLQMAIKQLLNCPQP